MFKIRKRMTPTRKNRRMLPINIKKSPKVKAWANSDINQTYTNKK